MKGVSLKSENIVPGWLTKKLRRLHQFSNHHPMMTRLPKPEQNVPTGPVDMGGQNGQGGLGGLTYWTLIRFLWEISQFSNICL